MACNFVYNNNNEIIDVRTEMGKPSELFRQALDYFGDRQQAIDLVAITKTEDFEDSVSYEQEEPSLNSVLQYISRTNKNQKTLSAQQEQDLTNSLISVNINSLEEFQDRIQQAFYPQGNIFAPTTTSLRNSGIYSPYEMENILSDIDLQERIKNAVEALNNSEIEIEPLYIEGQLQKTNEINSFGKLSVLNPYIIEQEALQVLGAPTSRDEYDNNLASLEYAPENASFEEMEQYVRAEEMQDINGEILPSPIQDTKSGILLGMKAGVQSDITSGIDTLLKFPETLIEENSDKIATLLKSIETGLARQGLDVIGIDLNKDFLRELQAFLLNPSTENTDSFVNSYNEYFGISSLPKTRVIKQQNKNRNYVYLETTKTEGELLNNNLLKVSSDNIFIKVRRMPIEQLYEIVRTYPEKYEGNLEEYVQNQMALLEDSTNGEELVLMKIYFDAPITFPEIIPLERGADFQGNYEYLTGDFIADFQAEKTLQKQKNSPQWKNFYSNFNINNKGLYLNSTDPITLATIDRWIEEIKPSLANNLKQYSIISRQLPIIGQQETETDEIINIARYNAVNYPKTIEKLNSESYRIDDNTLIAKNNPNQFIRIGQDVFETVESKGDMSLFVKLPQANSSYKEYNISRPKTEVKLQDYNYLENMPDKWMSVKNTLSKEKREEITQNSFDC